MNGEHTCATCKHFKSLGYMNKEERKIFLDACIALGLDPSEHGICLAKKDEVEVVRKDGGRRCRLWEARK